MHAKLLQPCSTLCNPMDCSLPGSSVHGILQASILECEKAIAYTTNVIITDGTIRGTVYGGGQIGRVETDAIVTIGTENESEGTGKPNITGNVFGAGAGVKTHGYSALVRGDATVTVQGVAQVGGSVYGGGEIASVGRFTVVDILRNNYNNNPMCHLRSLLVLDGFHRSAYYRHSYN